MAVDSTAIVARVRCFKDDLQLGLARFYRLQKLDLGTKQGRRLALQPDTSPSKVWVEADGVRHQGRRAGIRRQKWTNRASR